MEIKILGTGCVRCKSLENLTREAVKDLGIEADIIKEEDIVEIMTYGIRRTPGLVINGKVVLAGQIPGIKEIKEIINQNCAG